MRVLLLKEEPDDPSDDPYRAAFAALGLELGLELDVDYLPLQHCEYDDSAAAAVLSAALLQLPTSAGGAAAADESTQPAAAEAPVASVACESVVVTAPRACTALTRALPLLEPEPELRWRAVKRAYVVGPRTAALLEAGLPHLEIIPPGGAPKAADLLEIVSAAVTAELQGSGAAADAAAAPLLRVHSTDRADSLAPKLRRLVAADPVGVGVGGLGVHQAAIYGMRPVPIEELTASLQQMGLMLPPPLPPPPPDGEEEAASAVGAAAVAECCCVVCFSPLRLAELAQISSHNHTVHGDGDGDAGAAGAAGAAGVGGGAGMASLSSSSAMGPSSSSSSSTSWMSDEKVVKLIAMGPTTSAALQSLGLSCAATAATPSPKGVADAVAAASAVGASASGDESQPADGGGGGGGGGGSVR
jgi:uroporphyrinogen-III synthase